MRVLLDTHALIWWQARSSKLSRRARATIQQADRVLVSAITCWEVATLLALGRISINRPLTAWLADMEEDPLVDVRPLSSAAAVTSFELEEAGFHKDPADRLIYATARQEMVPLVTTDERITRFARRSTMPLRVIW